MATARAGWLNREKLAFVASAALLAAAALYAVRSRPEVRDPGEHRAVRIVPGKLAMSLEASGNLEALLAGGRGNPFEHQKEAQRAKAVPIPAGGGAVAIPPKDLFNPVQGDAKPERPARLQVPVNFVAIMRAEGGEPCVIFKVKKTGEHRRLVEGDTWPEINLKILRISMSGVLLENPRGERFQMLDCYGRKATGGDHGFPDGIVRT